MRDVCYLQWLEPGVARAGLEDLVELIDQGVLVSGAAPGVGEALVALKPGGVEAVAEALPELLSVGGDGDVAAVGALVIGVGGGATSLEAGLGESLAWYKEAGWLAY